MTRTNIFLSALLFLLIQACSKDWSHKDDFSGDGIINGRLLLVDTPGGSPGQVPLPGRKVYLSYYDSNSDTINYLYSRSTDSQGYFSFPYLSQQRAYLLFFRDTVGGVPRIAVLQQYPSTETAILIAATDNSQVNGLYITARSEDGSLLPGSSLCIFNSRELARSESCAGSVYNEVLPSSGAVLKRSLPAGKYFIRATFVRGQDTLRSFDSVEVGDRGLASLNLVLRPSLTPPTGFRLIVTDTTGSPVNGATTCVFINRTRWLADTCTDSVFALTADVAGYSIKTGLSPATYYLRTTATFGSATLKSLDSVVVVPNMVSDRQVRLR